MITKTKKNIIRFQISIKYFNERRNPSVIYLDQPHFMQIPREQLQIGKNGPKINNFTFSL